MKLSPAQLEQFDREGYLFFPSLFTPEEIGVLLDEVPRLYAEHPPENVRERGSDPVRTNFAAHLSTGRWPSMILFHACLVHASTSNLSPWNRVSVYLSLCAVSNHIRRFKRPEYTSRIGTSRRSRACPTIAC